MLRALIYTYTPAERIGVRGAAARLCFYAQTAALLCALTAGLLPLGLYAQSDSVRVERLSKEEGLSHNDVYALWQDREGFMWFGTGNGLNKYNGHSFTVYTSNRADTSTLSDSWITTISEDASGALWIGTRNGGLNRFDRKTGRFSRYRAARPVKGLSEGWITALHTDGAGRLWVGTMGHGLFRLDLESGAMTRYTHTPADPYSLSSNRIWCLYEDRAGSLWVGTWAEGLNRFDDQTERFERYGRGRGGLSSSRIRAIYEDRADVLWVGTSGGGLNKLVRNDISRAAVLNGSARSLSRARVYKHNPEDSSSLSDNKVWALHEDSNGAFWVGTFDGGLNRLDRKAGRFTRVAQPSSGSNNLGSSVIACFYEDRSGVVWIGTDQGIYKLMASGAKAASLHQHDPTDPNSLSHNDVLAVYASRRQPGTVWLGTNGGGLNRFDGATQRFTPYTHDPQTPSSLSHNVVSAIVEDASGTVWVGTAGGGLDKLNPQTGRFTHYTHDRNDPASLSHNVIRTLLADSTGVLWIGTDGGGLNRFDPRTETFTRYQHVADDPASLGDDNINTLYMDRRGVLWIGTYDRGLVRFNPSTQRFTCYEHIPGDPHSLVHNRVVAILEDASGALWVGTYGGLNKLDAATERFTLFAEPDGLPGPVILGLAQDDDGVLWVHTNRGLAWLRPETQSFEAYSKDAVLTLQPNPAAFATARSGALLLGGVGGFSLLPPPAMPDPASMPPLLITSFTRLGEPAASEIHTGETVRLSHKDTFFSFDVVLLEYATPERHHYQYRLEGFDTQWRRADGPVAQASYTNLDARAGAYRLTARGASGGGAWSETWILIQIAPPWWRTWWFWASVLLGILATGVAAAVYRCRVKRVEQAEKRRILAESRESERHFLARELHDEPLQNLYSVRHKLEVFARAPGEQSNQQSLADAQAVLDQTAESLRRICRNLRPPTLAPFGLAKTIRSHALTFERLHPELSIVLDLASDKQTLPEQTRLVLFRIYQSALNNVLRHAQARHAWIYLRLEPERVTLEVKDDGQGFVVPKNWLDLARNRHYGLLGIAEWVKSAGGVLDIRSLPGQGTLVRVEIPREQRTPGSRPWAALRRLFRSQP